MRSLPKDEFGREYLLAVGEQYGVRGWSVRGGKLAAACNHRATWEPGINVAKCRVDEYGSGWQPYYTGHHVMGGWLYTGFDHWNLEKKPPAHDDAPREDCTCGFYAYSNPRRAVMGSVKGVVRITGRTLVGTKGWRFEYGEIVALLNPHAGKGEGSWSVTRASYLESLRANYPTVPIFKTDEEMFEAFPLTELEADA
ncbi:MAG: hypothetical protein KGL35_19175 [Bradyrhizobium sp.]|nr:hypothetical protein [Bradyrhizobium sp.]